MRKRCFILILISLFLCVSCLKNVKKEQALSVYSDDSASVEVIEEKSKSENHLQGSVEKRDAQGVKEDSFQEKKSSAKQEQELREEKETAVANLVSPFPDDFELRIDNERLEEKTVDVFIEQKPIYTPSSVALLSRLEPSFGQLDPPFSSEIEKYFLALPESAHSIVFNAVAIDENAYLDEKIGKSLSIPKSQSFIRFTIVSEDKKNSKTYEIAIDRACNYTSPLLGVLAYVNCGQYQRDEISENTVKISRPFRMAETLVTRKQFLEIFNDEPSDTKVSVNLKTPVQNVSWYHAIAFCNKLSLLEGLEPVYTIKGVKWERLDYSNIPDANNQNWNAVTCNWQANGYRLPTEAEWLWAAMGADKNTNKLVYDAAGVNLLGYLKAYAGSSESGKAMAKIDDYVWHSSNSKKKTQAVREKLPNELGLFDMSGNVWEWCWDWFKVLPNGRLEDYRGAETAMYKVLRGGSFVNNKNTCSLSSRSGDNSYGQNNYTGFRVVRN